MLAGMYAFSSAVEVYHRAEQSFGGLLPLWFYRRGVVVVDYPPTTVLREQHRGHSFL